MKARRLSALHGPVHGSYSPTRNLNDVREEREAVVGSFHTFRNGLGECLRPLLDRGRVTGYRKSLLVTGTSRSPGETGRRMLGSGIRRREKPADKMESASHCKGALQSVRGPLASTRIAPANNSVPRSIDALQFARRAWSGGPARDQDWPVDEQPPAAKSRYEIGCGPACVFGEENGRPDPGELRRQIANSTRVESFGHQLWERNSGRPRVQKCSKHKILRRSRSTGGPRE